MYRFLSLWQKIILKLSSLKSKEPPHDEYVLGFIRLDSGLLNNKKSLQIYLDKQN